MLMSPPNGKGIKMTITEVHRELNLNRYTPEALRWIIMHMACDQPDRYRDATRDMDTHMRQYPDSRKDLVILSPVQNNGKCCTEGPVCCCNTATCNCKCAGCMCDF